MKKVENLLKNFKFKINSNLKEKVNKNPSVTISKKERGITLIALVVTVVILIILATVSINVVMGEDGLIKRAENTKNIQKMGEEKERLELVKLVVSTENKGKIPLEKFVEELIKEEITTQDDVETNEDGSKQVITDNNYSVNIKQDGEYNVIIEIEGKVDGLPVKIVDINLTTSTNSIKIELEVERAEKATYKYYYKLKGTEYGKAVYEGPNTIYTIENLKQDERYVIKVEATNRNGTVVAEKECITGNLGTAEGVIEFGDLEWNNGQAEVTVTKNTVDNLRIQYRVLDKDLNVIRDYIEITSGSKTTGLNHGETVEVRLWDGTNGSSTASMTVEDKTIPNEAKITLSSTTTNTTSSITATVEQSDNQSGVDITKCKWEYNTNGEKIGLDESSYSNAFTETPQILPLSATTKGTYYLHVLTVDKAGNKIEKVSSAVTVNVLVTGVSLNKTSATINPSATLQLTATVSPSNATNKNITWSSSNENILKVDENGKVTRVSNTTRETVIITATTKDGSNKTATCSIEVYQLVTTITTTSHETTKTVDTLGNFVEVPGGFKVHEDTAETVDEGIVITDGTNEFVWVPVDETSFNAMFGTSNTELALCGRTNVTTNYYSNLRVRSGDSSSFAATTPGTTSVTVNSSSVNGVREPDLVVGSGDASTSTTYYSQAGFASTTAMAQGFVEDYTNMRASIEKYDGFYIGRYELTGTVASPTVQAGAVLTADSSQAKNWYGLYKACRNVKANNSYVTSTMIWGCQWDETMNWLRNCGYNVDSNSTSWGNYSDSSGNAQVKESNGTTNAYGKLQNTGYSKEYWSANNICDLAGNCYEWTQEAGNAGGRMFRGRLLQLYRFLLSSFRSQQLQSGQRQQLLFC